MVSFEFKCAHLKARFHAGGPARHSSGECEESNMGFNTSVRFCDLNSGTRRNLQVRLIVLRLKRVRWDIDPVRESSDGMQCLAVLIRRGLHRMGPNSLAYAFAFHASSFSA
jgi:hypothetical protein